MSDALPGAPAASVIRKSLLLNCSQLHAFRVFTERMGNWWPATHHVGEVPFREIVIEPRTGGRWYEVNTENREGEWGHVLAWDPPHRVVISWHLDANFEFHPEMARASELDIRFIAEGASRTRLEFEHRGIERHGAGYQKLRDQLDGGWIGVLDAFAALAHGSASGTPSVSAAAATGR